MHLWLGLTAGLVLSLIGLSGSFLVFYGPALEVELGRNLFHVEGKPAHRAAVDKWIASAYRTYSDIGTLNFVMGPGFGQGGGDTANLGTTDPESKRLIVTIDPITGKTFGKFVWEETYTTWILRFHARLTNSFPMGHEVVVWLGVIMLVSMATGLYLWWPRNGNWYAALTFKRGAGARRRLLDLHNVFAIYLFVPLLVLGVTGIYLIKPNWIDPLVPSVERTPDSAALARAAKPGSCAARTTPGQAVNLAQDRFPEARFALVGIPADPKQPYVVQLASAHNLHDKGQTRVYVDRECPVILTTIDGEVRIAMETLKAVGVSPASNLMLGPFGSAMVFLAGILLPFRS